MKLFYLHGGHDPVALAGDDDCWLVVISDAEVKRFSCLVGFICVLTAVNCLLWLSFLSWEWSQGRSPLLPPLCWAVKRTAKVILGQTILEWLATIAHVAATVVDVIGIALRTADLALGFTWLCIREAVRLVCTSGC